MNAWQVSLVKTLEESFRAAGVKKAAKAARFAIFTLLANKNPRRASKHVSPCQVAPSTFSGWLSQMEWRAFAHGINRWSRGHLKALLRQHPPDNRGCVNIADVHQEEYEPDWIGRWRKTKRRLRPELSRRQISVKATAKNKKSTFANPWLVCALTWTCKGREWTIPYHFELVTVGKHGPDYHARQMCKMLRSIGITPSSNLLDGYYQSVKVRKVFREFGWKYRIRHRARGKFAQLAVDLDGMFRTRTTTLLAETINHPKATRKTRMDYHEGHYVMEFVRSVRVRLGGDQDESQLVLIAGAKRDPKGPRFVLDEQRSMIIACTPGDDAREVIRDYRMRWSIENLFRRMVNAAPNHAPKTVPSHVFAFLGHATHINLAYTKLNEDQAAARDGAIRGTPAAQWTLAETASEVLGEDPLTAPVLVT